MDSARVNGDAPDATPSVAKMTTQQPSGTRSASNTPSTAKSEGRVSKNSTSTNSSAASPLASRETSPVRNPRRTASSTRLGGVAPRTKSQPDPSPSRTPRTSSSGPSASSKIASNSATPSLPPTTRETQIQSPTPQKPSVPPEPKDSPRWPVSPRLRSPPPQLTRPSEGPSRLSDIETPAISLQRPTPSSIPSDSQNSASGSDAEDGQSQSGLRTPARAAGLETVQEVSLPNSPAATGDSAFVEQVKQKLAPTDAQSEHVQRDGRTHRSRPNMTAQESGSDSSSLRAMTVRRPSSVPPPLVSRQSSALSTKQLKAKQEGSTQNMTVETETVPSIPQAALATGTKAEGANGTLKAKPSVETIKPKKDKKKTVRKQPAVGAGNASSKADIFEAKIASAVDEQNTSDSEETFVYDSNPPDNTERAGRRFHSRTPSATSMVSQADRQNLRSIYGVLEGGAPAPKKSMKFVNSFNGATSDTLTPGEDDGKGTVRSNGGSGRGTARHHHHIGRWGRQPGNGHASLFDNESPFPNAAKSKLGGGTSRNSSGPPSPRNHNSPRGYLSSKRSANHMSASYDLDDTTGADDERTPLMGPGRQNRNSRYRRGPHNLRQAESQTFTRRSSYLNRFAACLVLTMMLLLVITGAIGFMFATSQPMTNIEIVKIKNVVTSEQVLMFDLTVTAHNPNIVVVTVDQANLEIFAKSEHAGTDSDWWKDPTGPPELRPFDDPISDPPNFPGDDDDDDDDSKPNVLLGTITEFDSPLTFEGSLFSKGSSASTGEMQLAYPGNSTSGGSKRWERIYQNEFDLIVKGVVKYSLPLSAHIRSATVSGRTMVKPNSANDPSLLPNTTLQDTKT